MPSTSVRRRSANDFHHGYTRRICRTWRFTSRYFPSLSDTMETAAPVSVERELQPRFRCSRELFAFFALFLTSCFILAIVALSSRVRPTTSCSRSLRCVMSSASARFRSPTSCCNLSLIFARSAVRSSTRFSSSLAHLLLEDELTFLQGEIFNERKHRGIGAPSQRLQVYPPHILESPIL